MKYKWSYHDTVHIVTATSDMRLISTVTDDNEIYEICKTPCVITYKGIKWYNIPFGLRFMVLY